MQYSNQLDFKTILQRIYSGNAVLFVGAGFSLKAKNFDNEVPNAKTLSKIIAQSIGEIKEYELKEIAEYAVEEFKKDKRKLDDFIEKMKDLFYIQKPSKAQIDIMSAPWKRVYTTNYDDSVELAAKEAGVRIESKNLNDKVDYNSKICLHINGRIEDLNEETLDTSFKLTHSSYLSADCFINSAWKSYFTDDIQTSTAIVFVGYSLYDIDIEKILFDNKKELKDKIYFIQREGNFDKIKDMKYEKYGLLMRIGIDNFAKKIKESKSSYVYKENEFYLESLNKYEMPKPEEINERNIEHFLLFGKLEEKYCVNGYINNDKRPPFLIKRTQILDALEILQKENSICINADIGNGKTLFLRQLAIELLREGKQVYHNFDDKGDIEAYIVGYKKDIEKLAKLKQEVFIILDSCCKYDALLQFIFERKYTNIKIILADRTVKWINYIRNTSYNIKNIYIDTLNDDEIEQMCRIIDNLSWWSEKVGNSFNLKNNYIKEHCKAEIAQTLLDIFKSQNIVTKYKEALENTIKNKKHSLYLYALCILNIMDIPTSLSILDEIIEEFDFKNLDKIEFKNIFNVDIFNKDITYKSPIFSTMILKELFDWRDIIEYSLNILEKLSDKKRKSSLNCLLNDIRTNLYRFRFIERILPDKNKKEALRHYYEKIKEKIYGIEQDPQYWLQYAMCHIMFKDYDKAQRLLNNAYDKAREDYDTYRIDNQQARLYLKKASLHATNIKESLELFTKANDKLLSRRNDSYTYNVILDYKEFVEQRGNSFSKENKASVINICKTWLNHIEKIKSQEQNRYKVEKNIMQCEQILQSIIKSLENA